MASVTTSREVARPAERRLKAGNIAVKTLIFIILSIWALIVIFPMLWALMTSLKTDQEIFFSPWALPP